MTTKDKTKTRRRHTGGRRATGPRPDTRRDALGSSGPSEAPHAPPPMSEEPEGADIDLVDEGGMGE